MFFCVIDLCVIDQQLCQDENSLLSFEAIRSIHKLMDDDADGTVDMTETDEVRDETLHLQTRPEYGSPTLVYMFVMSRPSFSGRI